MKRRSNVLAKPEEPEGSGSVKRAKLEEDSSDTDTSTTPRSSRSKQTDSRSDTPKSARAASTRSGGRREPNDVELAKRGRQLPKRAAAAKRTSARLSRPSSSDSRKAASASNSDSDKEEDSEPGLKVVPKYVDYFLLPGTTLTIHRKEFINTELKYTAKTMATKLATKVSRAVKKGEYTYRAALAPNQPLQRPQPLHTPNPKPTQPLNPIALDLKQNRKEPPRPKKMK